jgi:NAD(P)-dependent dehydrogenase (short-subunit alcohol dehydrogenase family)
MGYKGLELDGKVAVVIGGSSGIGRTLARTGRSASANWRDWSERRSFWHPTLPAS